MLKVRIKKENQCKKKKTIAIKVKISYMWPMLWDQNHCIEKIKYKAQFLTISMLNDEIEKIKSILTQNPMKKKTIKKISIKFNIKIK